MLLPFSVRANLPGGGTNGPNVTLVDNGGTVTLANGTISIVVTKADASIHTINYTFNNTGSPQTINVLGGGYSGGKLYWENSSDLGPSYNYTVVANPASTGGNYAEVMLTVSGSGNVSNIMMEVHFSLLRGNSGFYVTPIWIHRNTDSDFSMGECRDNIYSGSIFNWMSVDATRNKLMPVSLGTAITVDSGPKEVTLWTNGIYAGQYEDKYKYSADYAVQGAWGWSSVGTGGKNVGLWDVAGSAEYMPGGPMKRELMSHMGTTILNTPHGSHYGGGTDSTFDAGEVWAKVCGPHFIYCDNITNTITVTNTAAQALFSDALAQSAAEMAAWPYYWFTNANYTPASGRGTVTGKIAIADTYNPNASASNLWVGVELQPPVSSTVSYDFQLWYKPYQFWTRTDANGNFTIPNVIAANGYTLYAFGPGAAGTFQSQNLLGANSPNETDIPASPFAVNVTAGVTNNLGTKTWVPARVGPTVFEIGYPDRTAGKFKHGEDWWVGDIGPSANAPSPVWSKFLEYPLDFPNGPTYVVGQSRWTTDWNFIQPVTLNSTGAYNPWGNNNGSTSTIIFNLPSAPANNGSLYLATASSYQGPLIVHVNGNNIAGVNGYDPTYDGSGNESDASIREGIHGLFADTRLLVPSGNLRAGQNTITINMRKGGYLANHSMYDYIRLELPGYIPPSPTGATAYAGNNGNLVCWPVQPGAASYNILRSTTSGSGYVSITNSVTGPVCGSGFNNASFLDTTALNGSTYYYVVRSVNPVGSSANSSQASATPDAGISASAPVAPTGLTVASAVHHSVTLNWNASAGANFYTIYRSTLFNNGGGASNILGTIVLNNGVTNTSYLDTSPTDGSIYRYTVAATAAGGTSANSSGAVAVPKPPPPASLPTSLIASSVITTNPAQNITLSWNPVLGAVGYAIYRATSASGPFMFLQSVATTTYVDYGLASNQIYYYRVAAVNAANISTYATDSANPNQAAPTSLTASATNAQITLNWSVITGATSYTVKRGTSAGNETITVVSGYAGTTYTNTSLANGTTYYYVVTATGSGGTSGNSPEASATPFANASGIWIADADGIWGSAANWSGGGIASGAASSADFSTVSLTANRTVTLDSARSINTLIFGDATDAFDWTITGTNTLTLGSAPTVKVVNQSATISTPLAGANGLSKIGLGSLVLSGATNSFTGGTTVNAGSLALDFSVTNSPATNLIPVANSLTLGGGTLQIVGSSGIVNTQAFASMAFTAGNSTIIAAPVSGANNPTLALGSLASVPQGVTVRFSGPATINGSGNVAATATITTTTVGAGTKGVLGNDNAAGSVGHYATVGRYDWASTDLADGTAGVSPYTILGGSQVAGFYQTTFGGNFDMAANFTTGTGQQSASTIRFNTPAATTLTIASSSGTTAGLLTCGGILVTPSLGVNNAVVATTANNALGTWQVVRTTSNGSQQGIIWQNNISGYLTFTAAITDGRQGNSTTTVIAKSGAGTVVFAPINGNGNTYSGQTFINEGAVVITNNSALGSQTAGAQLNLNGGTLVGNGTFVLDNAGASLRPINLLANGGGLAAATGNTMVVDGVVGSAAGAGLLTIGIPALSANNFTVGLLPGNGPGTANTTPVYATGKIVLTNANYFTGGTVLQSGTLNINGINALGGANYGGLTFNGGTLQYAANLTGNNGSADLTSIGTAGVALAVGGGTIDVNGNAVTYAGSSGNGGSGSLVVNSSLVGGSLNLQGANTYSGSTIVTNTTLFINNLTGSATGAGDVIVQNGGVLGGTGSVDGSITVAAGGALVPGGTFNDLSIGNDLTLAAGSTTTMQIQHSPLTNNAVDIGDTLTAGGALVVTNVSGSPPALGDSFQLFNAENYAGAFTSLTLPTLATKLCWNTNLLNTSGIISVVALTSPMISGIQTSGTNLVISGSGGPSNWPYLTLATTNLTAPVWIPVVTNQFDAAGNFSVTNPISPNRPQTFYKMQLQ